MYGYYGLFDDKLLFSTFREYQRKRGIIRQYFIEMYERGEYDKIIIYRMYVYARPFIGDKTKDMIWEEITGLMLEEEY